MLILYHAVGEFEALEPAIEFDSVGKSVEGLFTQLDQLNRERLKLGGVANGRANQTPTALGWQDLHKVEAFNLTFLKVRLESS